MHFLQLMEMACSLPFFEIKWNYLSYYSDDFFVNSGNNFEITGKFNHRIM